MSKPRHPLIPVGDFCYARVPLEVGEALEPWDSERCGRELREVPTRGGKRVLCPFWQRTDHGTVRCAFTGDEEWENAGVYDAVGELFGYPAAHARFRPPHVLEDEIKTCGVNEDDGDDDTDEDGVLSTPCASLDPAHPVWQCVPAGLAPGLVVQHPQFGRGRIAYASADTPESVWLHVVFAAPHGEQAIAVTPGLALILVGPAT